MSEKEWFDYLTNKNYLSLSEIEYRRLLIEKDNINYNKLLNKIINFREKNKKEITIGKEKFFFVETKKIKQQSEEIKKFWKTLSYVLKEKFKNELLLDTLMKEAYHSSTIEGAHSTKKRTEEIIKKNLTPANKSEKMIFNNFQALKYISKTNEILSKNLILKLHKILTKDTLEENESGLFRNDAVDIVSENGQILFSPTGNIQKMEKMLEELINFVNTDENIDNYIDKIYKIIIFHFLFGYIHPFFDGNGRVVRMLFTYLLIQNDYDMFFYISLSEIINNGKNRKNYEQAFLKVERNHNDMTFFFYFILDIMIEALKILEKRVHYHFKKHIINQKIDNLSITLTSTQQDILKIFYRSKNNFIHINEISKKMKKSHSTIYKNIKTLKDYALITNKRIGRKIFYTLNLKD